MKQKEAKLNLTPLASFHHDESMPFVIAGPCSAESESQLMRTATRIKETTNVAMLRAGVWKPRTRPDSYEGAGSKSLKWLRKARSETGLPVAVEVARARHVYDALDHNIDAVWIGARTTVNPFAVQEVADALKDSEVEVFVKNPICPDLDLWIGALERLNQAGVTRLAAIHRGFATETDSIYRNRPSWEIPLKLKRLFPDLPLICDPSHISGCRDHIQALSQRAIDLSMDGLMIECHDSPENALSDSAQQLDPESLRNLLESLKVRAQGHLDKTAQIQLEQLREEIDSLDNELLTLIGQRVEISQQIGSFKKERKMKILQVNRWREMLQHRLHRAEKMGLDIGSMKKIYDTLHKQSIAVQSKIIK